MKLSIALTRVFMLVIIVIILIALIVSSLYIFQSLTPKSSRATTSSYPLPPGPYQPNVILICPGGTNLANHECVSSCPASYMPVNMTNDLSVHSDSSPVCLDNGVPLSIDDLAGLQVSDDNGASVFRVITNVPMMKMNIAGQNYNTNIWLEISSTTFDNLTTVTETPNVTTVIGTVGDTIDTFNILSINETTVVGNVTIEYPICCSYTTRAIHVGDDIGLGCLGISEILKLIDHEGNAVFTRVVSTPPAGGCPIWTESSISS